MLDTRYWMLDIPEFAESEIQKHPVSRNQYPGSRNIANAFHHNGLNSRKHFMQLRRIKAKGERCMRQDRLKISDFRLSSPAASQLPNFSTSYLLTLLPSHLPLSSPAGLFDNSLFCSICLRQYSSHVSSSLTSKGLQSTLQPIFSAY